MDITKQTFEFFKLAGWHPGRKVEVSGVLSFLENKGFLIHEALVDFLQEFGQLEFETLHLHEPHHVQVHHTFAQKAVGRLKHSDFKSLEEKYNEKMIPVGELYHRYLYLFISEKGSFYTDFGCLGDSFPQAFQNLLQGRLQTFHPHITHSSRETFCLHNLCLVTDKTMPERIFEVEEDTQDVREKLKFAGYANIYEPKPLYFPEKTFERAVLYRDYYRFGITDPFLDRVLSEHPGFLKEEEIPQIRKELAKLRHRILLVKEEAKTKKTKAFDGSDSLEFWPVEHCAEIWAARNAILRGVGLDRLVFRLLRPSDHTRLPRCSHCKRIFGNP
jgi:hypothetical protein